MSLELKIKALSLVAEAHIIRRYESKIAKARSYWMREGHRHLNAQFISLQNHRKLDVRREARATHLARMFLKGVDYLAVEQKCYEQPNWDKVFKMVVCYGGVLDSRVVAQRFEEWKQSGSPQQPIKPDGDTANSGEAAKESSEA